MPEPLGVGPQRGEKGARHLARRNPHRVQRRKGGGLVVASAIGTYACLFVTAFCIYSGVRWIGDTSWLGVGNKGQSWVPPFLGALIVGATFFGVLLFAICLWQGSIRLRLVSAMPGLILTCIFLWIICQFSMLTVFPALK